jgi:hypothetical protein
MAEVLHDRPRRARGGYGRRLRRLVRWLFAALVLLAVVSTLLGSPGRRRAAGQAPTKPAAAASRTTPVTRPAAPVETQTAPPDQAMVGPPVRVVVRSAPSAARAAAAAFLASYLRLSYGHDHGSALTDATPSLAHYLTSPPPQVTPAIKALHPRVDSVALERTGGGWVGVATISDGASTYVLSCAMTRSGTSWEASSLRVS